MIKVLKKSGTQGMYINIIKAIYSRYADNIKLNGEKLKVIPLKSGTRQSCQFTPYLFNTVPEVLAGAIRQQKKIKGIQIGKEEVKLLHIVYISDAKNSTRELLQLINTLSNVSEYKINSNRSVSFLYPND